MKKGKKKKRTRTSSSVVDVFTLGATISARCKTLCSVKKNLVSDSKLHGSRATGAVTVTPLFRGLALRPRFATQDEGITRSDSCTEDPNFPPSRKSFRVQGQ